MNAQSDSRENGGLFALNCDEAERLLDWYYAKCAVQRLDDRDGVLAQRISTWVERNSEAEV